MPHEATGTSPETLRQLQLNLLVTDPLPTGRGAHLRNGAWWEGVKPRRLRLRIADEADRKGPYRYHRALPEVYHSKDGTPFTVRRCRSSTDGRFGIDNCAER
jgi:hypothetical protein